MLFKRLTQNLVGKDAKHNIIFSNFLDCSQHIKLLPEKSNLDSPSVKTVKGEDWDPLNHRERLSASGIM